MSDWLLILGAGASAPAPSGVPTFDPLAKAILNKLGWHEVTVPDQTTVRPGDLSQTWARRDHPSFPTITPRRLPPEVVFGILHRYGVPFATDVRKQFAKWKPNAGARGCSQPVGGRADGLDNQASGPELDALDALRRRRAPADHELPKRHFSEAAGTARSASTAAASTDRRS